MSGKRDTLVVLRAGWPFALRASAYRTFFRRGLRVVVVDRPANAGLRIADTSLIAELSDPAKVLAALAERIDLDDVAGVVTFNDGTAPLAARMARTLGLPGMDPEAAERARDKIEQRRLLAAAGLAVPELRVVGSGAEAVQAATELGRCVVKPADSTASGEVRDVRKPADAEGAYAAAARRSPSGRVLVEAFIEGAEMSVETVSCDGEHRVVGITDTRTGGDPFFIELGHTAPSARWDRDEIGAEVASVLSALGVDHGLTCTEVKLTDRGPMIVEVNPRPAGDAVLDLLSLCLDFDVHDLVVDLALGLPISAVPAEPVRGASIAFLLNPVGRVESIEVGEPVRPAAPPWLVDFAVWARVGEQLGAARSNGGRAAYAIAVADEPQEADARAQLALDAIRIEVEA